LDIQPALAKIIELLKPGRRLFIAEPNLLNLHIFLNYELALIRPINPYVSLDETDFVLSFLHIQMMELGFDNIEILLCTVLLQGYHLA